MGWDRSRRQCLIELSSRSTIGRPVPRLILRNGDYAGGETRWLRAEIWDVLMVEPVEAQPYAGRYHLERAHGDDR